MAGIWTKKIKAEMLLTDRRRTEDIMVPTTESPYSHTGRGGPWRKSTLKPGTLGFPKAEVKLNIKNLKVTFIYCVCMFVNVLTCAMVYT